MMRQHIIEALYTLAIRAEKRSSDLQHYGWGGTAWTQPVLPLGRPTFKS